jgi:hypothetical protein
MITIQPNRSKPDYRICSGVSPFTKIIECSRYDKLGVLMITVAWITLILPLMTVAIFYPTRYGKPGLAIKKLRFHY